MQKEGMKALVYGCTGAIGSVKNTWYRILLKCWLLLLSGLRSSASQGDSPKNGISYQVAKRLSWRCQKIWTNTSSNKIITMKESILFSAALDLKLVRENRHLSRLTIHTLSSQLTSLFETVSASQYRNSSLYFVFVNRRLSQELVPLHENEGRSWKRP